MTRRATEPFGRTPKRLSDDLALGRITLPQWAFLTWLEVNSNHNLDPPRYIGTVATIHASMGWPWSHRQLREQVLQPLRANGYISYDVEPGSPKPFEIFPLRSLVEVEADDETGETYTSPSDSDVQLSSRRGRSKRRATRDAETERAGSRAPRAGAPQTPASRRDEIARSRPTSEVVRDSASSSYDSSAPSHCDEPDCERPASEGSRWCPSHE